MFFHNDPEIKSTDSTPKKMATFFGTWAKSIFELSLVMGVALIPMFIMANEIDKDEWQKAGITTVLAGTGALLITVYKIWKGSQK